MTQRKVLLGQDPAFEPFLGASVGEDEKGMNVTVLSMLARLNVDPWDEASDLALMQDASARQRLEALMKRFKDVPALVQNRGKIISRLISVLPGSRNPAAGPASSFSILAMIPPMGTPLYWVIAAALVFCWVLFLSQGN